MLEQPNTQNCTKKRGLKSTLLSKNLTTISSLKGATEKFLSKKVMADVPFIIRRQADLKLLTPPLPNLFFLYLIAAEAIELSHQIDIEGTIRFIKGAEQKRIEQKASMAKRLEAIAFELTDQLTSENADQVYEHHVNSLVREIRYFIEHQDLRLNFSFIQRRYDRYFIAKDHGSAKRQILTNFLIHRYASTFIVQTQTFSKKDSSTSIYKRQQRTKIIRWGNGNTTLSNRPFTGYGVKKTATFTPTS